MKAKSHAETDGERKRERERDSVCVSFTRSYKCRNLDRARRVHIMQLQAETSARLAMMMWHTNYYYFFFGSDARSLLF
jgi:hypothetical protein